MSNTIVIGAGWAGLSCAYELAKHGHKVRLLEAAPQVGGRARSINFAANVVDNGQHVAIGAYQNLRTLISDLGLTERQLFKILPLRLLTLGQDYFQLHLPKLPSPFHLGCGVMLAKNLTWREKLSVVKLMYELQQTAYTLPIDVTVLDFLQQQQQSQNIIRYLWEPLTVAALSTPIHSASAQVLINVLQQTFKSGKNNSDWYLPAVDLSNLLPTHIVQYLQQQGSDVVCNQTVKNLNIDDDICKSINSEREVWAADHYVLATNLWQANKLLAPFPLLATSHQQLKQFVFEPITTVYFLFAHAVRLPYPIIGILDSVSQWIFDRAFAAQPNMLSAVTTGHNAIFDLEKDRVYTQILQDIQRHFPWLKQPIAQKIVREKRAAFSCDVNIQKLRPHAKTACKNLWLAGDYVQTGLPATLEGALLSGKQTAHMILRTKLD